MIDQAVKRVILLLVWPLISVILLVSVCALLLVGFFAIPFGNVVRKGTGYTIIFPWDGK